jgi:multidrug resistance efflux pump
MSNGATVQTGLGLDSDQEAAHAQQLAETYADEAEQAVKLIEEKLAGMQASLKTAKADAKRLRAEADKGAEG